MSPRREELSELSDEEIVRGIKARTILEDNGVEELVTRQAPSLWRYLYRRYSRDEALIDDVVAETVLTIWENFEKYDPDRGRFISWAIGIAHNKLREAFRRTKRYEELSTIDIGEEDEVNIYEVLATTEEKADQVDYKELEKQALEIVISFSDLDRTLFLLKSNYDLTFEELASMLNKAGQKTTPDAVSKRFYRMRKKLKQLFENKE